MKHQFITSVLRAMIVAALILITGMQQVYAAGTIANTTVASQATISYKVGGTSQSDVLSPPVGSAGSGEFLVDRRINLTVAESGGSYTNVTPNTTLQALTFTVTNGTNDMIDIRLFYTDDVGGTGPFGGTDSFNASGTTIRLESGATAGFQDLEDLAVTFLDDVPADGSRTVYVVSTISASQVNNDLSSGTLTGVANTDGTGGAANDYVESTGAGGPGSLETVFGDAPGDTDAARDGKHSDDDGYLVVTATITVTKTITVISDPFNGTTNPRAIPGAIVEYCIIVTNTGSAAAANVVTVDPIPVNSTYKTGTIIAVAPAVGGGCTGGTPEDDDAIGLDEGNNPPDDIIGSSYNAGTNKITTLMDAGTTLGVGMTTTTRFQVTID